VKKINRITLKLKINKMRKYRIVDMVFEKMYENGTIKPKYFNMIVSEENVKLGSDLTNSENAILEKIFEMNIKTKNKDIYRKFNEGKIYFKHIEPFSIHSEKMGTKPRANHSCSIITKYLLDNDSYILNKNFADS
jgi:hypothetical protein